MKIETIMKYAFIGIAIILAALFLFDSEPVQFASPGEGFVITDESEIESGSSGLYGMTLVGTFGGRFQYYRDSVTDVMYLWCAGGNKGGLTTMLDPETGLPLTYSRYLDLAQGG